MRATILHLRDTLVPRYGKGETEAIIRLIFHHLKGWNTVDLLMNEDKTLSLYMVEKVKEIEKRLLQDEPIQYIVGDAYFYGMDFVVNRDVLIPRPETEELVDMIVSQNGQSDLDVLDIATGSGCIAIALARNLPFSKVTALDISEKALEVARLNAQRLKAKIDFIHADILTYAFPDDSFDIIVSNPPYVDDKEKATMDANVLRYEPASALFVPDDNPLVFYRRIAAMAHDALRPGGRLYLEINPLHADDMQCLLADTGFIDIQTHLDIHGKKRIMSCRKKTDTF